MIKANFQRRKMARDSRLNAKRMNRALFFCGLLLVSCAEKVVEPPENLIPKDKMTEILYDLALVNAAFSVNRVKFQEKGIEVMPFLYNKYGIDSVQFVTSDIYYASLPLEYEDMYETILARLEETTKEIEDQRKQKNDSIRKMTDKVKDSLKKVTSKKQPTATSPSKK